jgi:prevent-host-death family protein
MKRMSAAKFKAHCLQVMEEVHATREPVVITKRGRPVAKLVPAGKDNFLGHLRGAVKIVGDIESPIELPESWEASCVDSIPLIPTTRRGIRIRARPGLQEHPRKRP